MQRVLPCQQVRMGSGWGGGSSKKKKKRIAGKKIKTSEINKDEDKGEKQKQFPGVLTNIDTVIC